MTRWETRFWAASLLGLLPLGLVMRVVSPAASRSPSPRAESRPVLDEIVAAAKSLDPKRSELGRHLLRRTSREERSEWVARMRPRAAEIATSVEDTLRYLDELQRRARTPAGREVLLPSVHDPELSLRAGKHALFLSEHRDLRWPVSHSEPKDLAGATLEGNAAGRASVIAYSNETIRDAIDAWMATWFHRLPILEGSLAVGWGERGSIHVLDVSTLEVGMECTDLCWPAADSIDVSPHFDPAGERPEPAPGSRERFLGYPATLQVSDPRTLTGVRGELRVRRAAGWEVVPCLFSSPDAPLQPLLVPRNAVCLLPRRALDPGAEHEVVFTLAEGRKRRWTFRTRDAEADVRILLAGLAADSERIRNPARNALLTLDSRWRAALPLLQEVASSAETWLVFKVTTRLAGRYPALRWRGIDEYVRDFHEGPRWKRLGALGVAAEVLAGIEETSSDGFALGEDSPDAAAALALLREGLGADDADVRWSALRGLRTCRTRHPAYEAELVARLGDDSAEVRSLAVEALGDLAAPTPPAMGAIYERLDDADEDVRWEATRVVLGREGSGAALVHALVASTESTRPQRRADAARRLHRFRDLPEARAVLERLAAKDPMADVRDQADRSLRGD